MTAVDPEGKPNEQPEVVIVLAGWGTRFWAWLVDFILVNVALGVIFAVASIPIWLTGFMDPAMMANGQWWNNVGGPFTFGINSLVFFAYWVYMESRHNGQSIGKMLLRIRTTNLEGKPADVKSIAISSFGKAFILPLDVLLGWIFTNDKRQRLLSTAANTIVIKADDIAADKATYVKD